MASFISRFNDYTESTTSTRCNPVSTYSHYDSLDMTTIGMCFDG